MAFCLLAIPKGRLEETLVLSKYQPERQPLSQPHYD